MNDWFSPKPYKYDEDQRLTLDFGLSAVTKHFNEQIVPKIGSVWQLRSISYALTSFELHKKLKSKLRIFI